MLYRMIVSFAHATIHLGKSCRAGRPCGDTGNGAFRPSWCPMGTLRLTRMYSSVMPAVNKTMLLLVCALLFAGSAHSQRIGYVEGERILEQMPEYQQATEYIQSLISNWEKEIDRRQLELDTLRRAFEKEKLLLTDEMRQERMQAIKEKERALQGFQNSRFGYGGMLEIQKHQQLEPVQEKLNEAIRIVSKIKRVSFMFDRSAGLFVPYANKRRDYTLDVINYLQEKAVEAENEEEGEEEEEDVEVEEAEDDDKF